MALHVVFVLFPNVTQLDFTAPAQVLARVPDARVTVAARSVEAVPTDCGFAILPASTFENAGQADLLCVPGGFGVADALADTETVGFIRAQAAGALYVTSVGTGAFLLGAAGLLRGRRATTHWAYTGLLSLVGATFAPGRVVVDRGTITGGGVTAGLDSARPWRLRSPARRWRIRSSSPWSTIRRRRSQPAVRRKPPAEYARP